MASTTPTASDISSLLETQMYNPNNLPQLESFLHSQIDSTNAYNFEANRTLLKLYQFSPSKANVENQILVQLLALIYGNDDESSVLGDEKKECGCGIDFGALGCLIPESTKKEEPFITLLRCADLMDSCLFSEFWTAYSSLNEVTKSYPKVQQLFNSQHAEAALRKSILYILSLSFQSTRSMDFIQSQLNFTNHDDLKNFLESSTCSGIVNSVGVDGDTIVFCSNAENVKREKAYQDGRVDYANIRSLMMRSNGISGQ